MTESRIEVASGPLRAVFMRTEQGWQPDWVYEGERARIVEMSLNKVGLQVSVS